MNESPDDTYEHDETVPETPAETNSVGLAVGRPVNTTQEEIIMDNAYPTHLTHHLEELILSNQIGGGFRDTLTSIHTGTADVTAAVDRNGLASVTETARQGSTNLGSTERNGGEVRASVERNGGETRSAVERSSGEIRAHMDRVQIALFGEICDIRNEASEHKSQIVLEGCKNTHALTLQASENASRAQLQASENAAAIAKQVAECCCEVKALVLSEHCTTRELIASQEQNRLRDALAAANQNLLVMQLKSNGPGNSGN